MVTAKVRIGGRAVVVVWELWRKEPFPEVAHHGRTCPGGRGSKLSHQLHFTTSGPSPARLAIIPCENETEMELRSIHGPLLILNTINTFTRLSHDSYTLPEPQLVC